MGRGFSLWRNGDCVVVLGGGERGDKKGEGDKEEEGE